MSRVVVQRMGVDSDVGPRGNENLPWRGVTGTGEGPDGEVRVARCALRDRKDGRREP